VLTIFFFNFMSKWLGIISAFVVQTLLYIIFTILSNWEEHVSRFIIITQHSTMCSFCLLLHYLLTQLLLYLSGKESSKQSWAFNYNQRANYYQLSQRRSLTILKTLTNSLINSLCLSCWNLNHSTNFPQRSGNVFVKY
jgi:hypothetical protein